MKSPLLVGPFVEFEVVASTQDEAARLLKSQTPAGIVLARHQTSGRGRFDRTWESSDSGSLTVSLVFELENGNCQPWLYAMALACAVSEATGLQHQWPNDIVWKTKKVGGILTEVISNSSGHKFAVIGLGLNLNQSAIPDHLKNEASSLAECLQHETTANDVMDLILIHLANLPEPKCWADLADSWFKHDETPGKIYKSPDGRIGIAKEIGEQGELIVDFNGRIESVYAADAHFGRRSE